MAALKKDEDGRNPCWSVLEEANRMVREAKEEADNRKDALAKEHSSFKERAAAEKEFWLLSRKLKKLKKKLKCDRAPASIPTSWPNSTSAC